MRQTKTILLTIALSCSTLTAMDLRTNSGVELGLEAYSYKYEESVNGAFFMSNEGGKYGGNLALTQMLSSDSFLRAEMRYATGDVKYESSSGTGDVSDAVFEGRLVVGLESAMDNYLLGSFAGIGYRALDNDLRDLGASGYRRESRYLYVPIGINHRFRLGDGRISTTLEYDWFLKGEQTSYLGDVSPWYASVYGTVVNKQKDGRGWRANLAYEERYWDIGDSQTNYYTDGVFIYSAKEPMNTTKELGAELKVRF